MCRGRAPPQNKALAGTVGCESGGLQTLTPRAESVCASLVEALLGGLGGTPKGQPLEAECTRRLEQVEQLVEDLQQLLNIAEKSQAMAPANFERILGQCFGLERAALALQDLVHEKNQNLVESIASCTQRAARLVPKSSVTPVGAGACAVGLRRWLGLDGDLVRNRSYEGAVGAH